MMDADAATVLKPSVEKFVAVCERFMSLLERIEKLVVKRIDESPKGSRGDLGKREVATR